MKENLILDKSKAFALRIIKLYNYLRKEKREFVISKQITNKHTYTHVHCTLYIIH